MSFADLPEPLASHLRLVEFSAELFTTFFRYENRKKPDSMKPVIILPPDTMTEENIGHLRDNGLCVVVAADPAAVKFIDPIPSVSSRTEIEDAAIQLSRKVMTKNFWSESYQPARDTCVKTFVDMLVKGTPLDPLPSQKEKEREAYDYAKIEAVREIAREEAREERRAVKEAARLAAEAKKKPATAKP